MAIEIYLKRIPKVATNKEAAMLLEENCDTRKELVAHGKGLNEGFDEDRHVESTTYFPAGWMGKEVGYWRKASHINRWFIENVSDGVNKYSPYIVTREQLETLVSLCYVVSTKKDTSLLPVIEGKDYGYSEGGDYYFQDVNNTIRVIEEILIETDWEKDSIVYRSTC
jgi:hypothetical protein